MAHPLQPQLSSIFSLLGKRDPSALRAARSKLSTLIDEEGDILLNRMNPTNVESQTLSKIIADGIQALSNQEFKLGCIYAVEAFMTVDYCDLTMRTMLFNRVLTKISREASDVYVATQATEIWGKLLTNGCALLDQIVAAEVAAAFEDIDAASLTRRLSACQLLYQVASHTTTAGVLVSRYEEVLSIVWNPLRDPNLVLREAAAKLLGRVLVSLAETSSDDVFENSMDSLVKAGTKALAAKQPEVNHGAILSLTEVLGVLAVRQTRTATYLPLLTSTAGLLPKIAQLIPVIRKSLFDFVAAYAALDVENFVKNVYPQAFQAALVVFREPLLEETRAHAFLTFGKLAQVMGHRFLPSLEVFIKNVQLHLEPSKKPKRDRCGAALSSLTIIAELHPIPVRPFVIQMMDEIFLDRLYPEFSDDISRLCRTLPELQGECTMRVLGLATEELRKLPRAGVERDSNLLNVLTALDHEEFSGDLMLSFVVEEILKFSGDVNPDVRKAVVKLCSSTIFGSCVATCKTDESGALIHAGRAHLALVTTVQRGLLEVAVADPDSDIRLTTLGLFSEKFDGTLSAHSTVSMLFPILNDKVANRVVAIQILGRIAKRNPAVVSAAFWRTIIQSLTECRYLSDMKRKQEALVVLAGIFEAAPSLVRPYVRSVFDVTISHLQPTSPPFLQAACLHALCSLAPEIGQLGEESKIFSLIVPHVLDATSPSKRQEAVRALAALIRTTRRVDIYQAFPPLISSLIQMLHGGFKQAWPLRRDVLTLIGIIGAVDPIRIKLLDKTSSDSSRERISATSGRSSDDPTAQMVVMAIIQTLNLHLPSVEVCSHAVSALVKILTSKALKMATIVGYLPEVIPEILAQVERSDRVLRAKLFQELSLLVGFVKQNIRNHLEELLNTVKAQLLQADGDTIRNIVGLLNQLRVSLNEEFKPYLAGLLPLLVQVVSQDTSDARTMTIHVFSAFECFGRLLDGHLHVCLPSIVDVLGSSLAHEEARIRAATVLGSLVQSVRSLSEHAARCINALCRVMSDDNITPKLQHACFTCLCTFVECLGEDFIKFLPVVRPQILNKYGASSSAFSKFSSLVDEASRADHRRGIPTVVPKVAAGPPAGQDDGKQKQDLDAIRKEVENVDRTTDEEWRDWLRTFCLQLLKHSPSFALRVCHPLAQVHHAFSRQLFHPAFSSCYNELDESMRNTIVDQLGKIVRNDKLPSEVLQELLNLAEYLERESILRGLTEGITLFDVRVLAERSERCNLHAKALHYLEATFVEQTRTFERGLEMGRQIRMSEDEWQRFLQICQKLIHQYNVLGQPESADGVLDYVKRHFTALRGADTEFTVEDPSMYEKLRWWSESYRAFASKYRKNPADGTSVIGMMTALDALGDFRALLDMWKKYEKKAKRSELVKCAHYGARAAWLLQAWPDLQKCTDYMSHEGYSGATASFYYGVISVQQEKYQAARVHIEDCRKLLDAELSALFAESYDRAYRHTVGLQQLCELEEIIDFKTSKAATDKSSNSLKSLVDLWSKRLPMMAEDPSEWQGTLANHALVVDKSGEIDTWLRFVKICRTSGRTRMSKEIISALMDSKTVEECIASNVPNLFPSRVLLAAVENEYESGKSAAALELLPRLAQYLTGSEPSVLAQCHTLLAQWTMNENTDWLQSPQLCSRIRGALRQSTTVDPQSSSSWHTWALVNQSLAKTKGCDRTLLDTYSGEAINGFVQTIKLQGGKGVVQDVLGFLSMWFTYGSSTVVSTAVKEAIDTIPIITWLDVIPQIIARLYTDQPSITEQVHQLLLKLGTAHPQALLFPLNLSVHETFGVVITKDMEERAKAAHSILESIKARIPIASAMSVVDEARLVSKELIRIAILFVDQARTLVEAAHDDYTQTKDVVKMWKTITDFRAIIDNPKTPSEENFCLEFGPKIYDIVVLLTDIVNGKATEINPVINLFRHIASTIEKNIYPNMTSLDLQYVSPELVDKGCNLSLVIPGHYAPLGISPRIQSFAPSLKVLSSGRRPRKITINGNDGVQYRFLLKGHEDMRQDERVMQVLGLVNTLLSESTTTAKKDLRVVCIPVTPLSGNAGLMTWVDDCTTIFDVIREYRAVCKIPITKEIAQINAMTDDTISLTVVQKVEVLEVAQEVTDGMDIARAMWAKAPSAEVWLARRNYFTKTVASMSMVGHIIGLGDRHLQNLMLQNNTGKVIHIDFGDCFEAAQKRAALPEKWPFRLTRMIVRAFEVGGIAGLYQHTCVDVMDVQRAGRDSLMAMLEAFVYDPLVNWRWNETQEPAATATETLMPEGPKPLNPTNLPVPASFNVARAASMRSIKARQIRTETQNRKGEQAVERIREKLHGTEFFSAPETRSQPGLRKGRVAPTPLTTEQQVQRLIQQATSKENLAQAYLGWCPFW
jgi:FKBP12-rapamycin complex-associated protein